MRKKKTAEQTKARYLKTGEVSPARAPSKALGGKERDSLLKNPQVWKAVVLVAFIAVSLISYSAITGRNTQIDKLQEEKDCWKSWAEVWQRTFFDEIKPISMVLFSTDMGTSWQISRLAQGITTLPAEGSVLRLVVGENITANYTHYDNGGVANASMEITISKIKERYLENYYFFALNQLLNPPERYEIVEAVHLGENRSGAWVKIYDNHWVGWVMSYEFVSTVEIKTQGYTPATEEIAGYLNKLWLNIESIRGGWLTIPDT